MQPALTDTELLLALKHGNETAFDRVYSLYYKPLCFFAERMVLNPTSAEDIVTDSFIKLLQKNPDFETLQHLKSFLYTSTRNACIDELRMQKRHQQVHQQIGLYAEPNEEDADHALIMAEVLFAVYQAINGLPVKYKEVVKLSVIDGLSNSEITIKTGMADQTIRNHKSEGIKLLRIALLKNTDISAVVLSCTLMYIGERFF